MKYSKYDIVIIGSGISGLYLANKLVKNNNFTDGILVITKEQLFSGSSALAQGGIVSVIPEINKKDSFESHIKDTMIAGCGLNDINAVKFVSESSSNVAQELIQFGVEFDKNNDNILNFTLEGAHSCPRILHSQGDSTGRVIEEALAKRLKTFDNVSLYENTMAVELLIDLENVCRGIVVFNHLNNSFEAIYSNNVVIASGGIGQMYKRTTNPSVSVGDGIAIAARSGAILKDMEFVQFHPTALFVKDKDTMPLVSESVRGEGGKLVDVNGCYFAKNYHHRADLAPRDVVARAILNQMSLTNSEYVNLDISQIGIENFKKRFPTITALCAENNIDISNGLLPVVPAEHYFMGGIKTDLEAKTSIKNLFAIGECASTGLHGANRLASNSLLECAVFANSLYNTLKTNISKPPKKNDLKVKSIVDKYISLDSLMPNDEKLILALFSNLKKLMTSCVGIVRSENSLKKANNELVKITEQYNAIPMCSSRIYFEFGFALCISQKIIEFAQKRKESIGSHYRADYIIENDFKEIIKEDSYEYTKEEFLVK